MTHGKKNLRIMLTGAVVAFAVAAPSAQAASFADGVHVCNQATANSLGGTFETKDGDQGNAARYSERLLKDLAGRGAGLLVAADRSGALSVCMLPETTGGESGYSWES